MGLAVAKQNKNDNKTLDRSLAGWQSDREREREWEMIGAEGGNGGYLVQHFLLLRDRSAKLL